jgi:Alanine-zipper, major outer membrane lipoprotein
MRNVTKRVGGVAVAALLVSTLGLGCSSKPNPETVAAAQRAESAAAKADSAAARAEAAAGRVEDAARRAEAAAQKAEAIFMKHMRK